MTTVALGEIASFIRGVTFKPSDVIDDGVAVMRTKNVQTSLDLSDIMRIPARLVKRSEQYLRAGDTLVSSANSWYAVGRACWVPDPEEPMAIGGFVTALRPTSEQVDARYLFRWFTTPNTQATLRSFSNKTTNISNLNLKRAAAMPLELPSLAEQRRIVAILDHADALRAKRLQAIAHLNALNEATFNDMFADVPATSTVEGEALLIRTGPFGSQLLHSEFVDEGIAVLGLDNVVANEFRWGERRFITPAKFRQLKRYTVSPGDVLISIMGTTGRCVVVPDDIPTAINTKHICAITPNGKRLHPSFLRAAFLWHSESRAHLRRQTKGSIMDGLNMGVIKAMPIPVPPLSRQREFAERARQTAAVRQTMTSAGAKEDQLFASLQAQAFIGAV